MCVDLRLRSSIYSTGRIIRQNVWFFVLMDLEKISLSTELSFYYCLIDRCYPNILSLSRSIKMISMLYSVQYYYVYIDDRNRNTVCQWLRFTFHSLDSSSYLFLLSPWMNFQPMRWITRVSLGLSCRMLQHALTCSYHNYSNAPMNALEWVEAIV